MTLSEFRKITEHLDDNVELVIEDGPCENPNNKQFLVSSVNFQPDSSISNAEIRLRIGREFDY